MSVTAICGSIKAYGSHVERKTARFSIQIELLRQMQNLRRPHESGDPFLPALKKMEPRLRGDDAAVSKRERARPLLDIRVTCSSSQISPAARCRAALPFRALP